MYTQITNPITGKLVNINSKSGISILKKYIHQLGGNYDSPLTTLLSTWIWKYYRRLIVPFYNAGFRKPIDILKLKNQNKLEDILISMEVPPRLRPKLKKYIKKFIAKNSPEELLKLKVVNKLHNVEQSNYRENWKSLVQDVFDPLTTNLNTENISIQTLTKLYNYLNAGKINQCHYKKYKDNRNLAGTKNCKKFFWDDFLFYPYICALTDNVYFGDLSIANLNLRNIDSSVIKFNYRLILKDKSHNNFEKFCKKIFNIIDNLEKRFYVFTASKYFVNGEGHANNILIDKLNRTIEYFEPHSGDLKGKTIHNKEYEQLIQNIFNYALTRNRNQYKFVSVNRYLPYNGVQELIDFNSGLCALFSSYYIALRLANPNLDRAIISSYLINGKDNILICNNVNNYNPSNSFSDENYYLNTEIVKNCEYYLILDNVDDTSQESLNLASIIRNKLHEVDGELNVQNKIKIKILDFEMVNAHEVFSDTTLFNELFQKGSPVETKWGNKFYKAKVSKFYNETFRILFDDGDIKFKVPLREVRSLYRCKFIRFKVGDNQIITLNNFDIRYFKRFLLSKNINLKIRTKKVLYFLNLFLYKTVKNWYTCNVLDKVYDKFNYNSLIGMFNSDKKNFFKVIDRDLKNTTMLVDNKSISIVQPRNEIENLLENQNLQEWIVLDGFTQPESQRFLVLSNSNDTHYCKLINILDEHINVFLKQNIINNRYLVSQIGNIIWDFESDSFEESLSSLDGQLTYKHIEYFDRTKTQFLYNMWGYLVSKNSQHPFTVARNLRFAPPPNEEPLNILETYNYSILEQD